MTASERWRRALEALAIPDAILAAAPETPWGFPPELLRRRTETAAAREPSALLDRAAEALPAGGTVLDVGCGAGASSIPLGGRVGHLTGVDTSDRSLEAFLEAASTAGVPASAIAGGWPEVADRVPDADAVVSGHVLYNVANLAPFVAALTRHARRRVVVEITERHPLAWTADLWERFHGIVRPDAPSADDAEAVLREVGLSVERDDREVEPGSGGFERRDDAVALVRRRLCLPAERDAEIAEALGDRLVEREGGWSAGPVTQRLVTVWWDGGARGAS